ncbi:hypothetical protein [Inediibacterium massiliense]|nr:hypothetical protein [Inediibacterium massiliense]
MNFEWTTDSIVMLLILIVFWIGGIVLSKKAEKTINKMESNKGEEKNK